MIFMIIVGTAFILLGMLSLREWFTKLIEGRASYSWPSAKGHVVDSTIESRHRTHTPYRYKDDWNAHQKVFINNKVQGAKVVYRYTIQGREYTGMQLQICFMHTGGLKNARNLVSRFVQGADVTVYYNPQNPENAVLIRGANFWGLTCFAAVGIVFTGFGALVVLKQLL